LARAVTFGKDEARAFLAPGLAAEEAGKVFGAEPRGEALHGMALPAAELHVRSKKLRSQHHLAGLDPSSLCERGVGSRGNHCLRILGCRRECRGQPSAGPERREGPLRRWSVENAKVS